MTEKVTAERQMSLPYVAVGCCVTAGICADFGFYWTASALAAVAICCGIAIAAMWAEDV